MDGTWLLDTKAQSFAWGLVRVVFLYNLFPLKFIGENKNKEKLSDTKQLNMMKILNIIHYDISIAVYKCICKFNYCPFISTG
jgi:hypothetical protein